MCLKKIYHRYFRPDFFLDSLLDLQWDRLQQAGILLIMFDIDNTLARHGSAKADPYAREVLSIARDKGFTCALVSNALTSRISQYAQDLEVDHLDQARKPSSKQIKAYLAQKGFDSQQVLLVGDQLFTDMWAGKSAGCQVALVKRRFSDEAPYVKVKRRLENSILKWFDHRINADWHR